MLFWLTLACQSTNPPQGVVPLARDTAVDTEVRPDSVPDTGDGPVPVDTAEDGEEEIAPLGYIQGSWRGPIRATESDPTFRLQCWGDNSWEAMDNSLLLDVLQSTNQNMYVANIGSAVENEGECEWENIRQMADLAAQRGLDMDLAVDLKSSLSKDEYIQGIATLRSITEEYPRLRSVVIDDFQDHLRAPWERFSNGFTISDVAQIWEATKSTDLNAPPVSFYPYITAKLVPIFLMPGFVLGIHSCPMANEVDCGVPKQEFFIYPDGYDDKEGDLLQMDTTFNLGEIEDGEEFVLSFMTYDLLTSALSDRELDIVVKVNGLEVLRRSLYDDNFREDYIDIVEVPLNDLDVPLSESADNSLSFSMEASGLPLNHWFYKMAFVWDLKIDRSAGQEITFPTENMNFTAYRDPTRSNYDEVGIEAPLTTDQFVVGTHQPWNFLPYIDGAFIKYSEVSSHRDAEVHERFIESVCSYLRSHDKKCVEVYWGNEQWLSDISFDYPETIELFQHTQEHSDGIVVWRLENSLAAPEKGIFSQRAPIDPDSYDVMAAYPSNTSAVPGWYQSWEIEIQMDGEHTVQWQDNCSGQNNLSGRMSKRIVRLTDGVEETLWEADINDPETTGEVVLSLDAGDRVRFLLQTDFVFGDRLFAAQFRALDPTGQRLLLEDSLFTTGVDEKTEKMYQCVTSFYGNDSLPAHCLE